MRPQENDFAAMKEADGQYVIRQLQGGLWVPVLDHEGRYDETEARRRLEMLRPLGDGFVSVGPGQDTFEIVQP